MTNLERFEQAVRDLWKLNVLLELAARGLGEHGEPAVAAEGLLHLAGEYAELQVELGETLDAMTPSPRMVPRENC